jgi:serine/threonine-protein kinase
LKAGGGGVLAAPTPPGKTRLPRGEARGYDPRVSAGGAQRAAAAGGMPSVSTSSLKSGLPKSLFGYHVLDRLGTGALSTIYAVKDPKTGEAYALKHVVPQTEKHLRFVEQLQNEFDVSRHFRHPGLRKCVDLKISKRMFIGGIKEAALVMEMVKGLSIDQEHPGALRAVCDCFINVGLALSALHHLRLVHCDLKPSNIIRDHPGNVKIIDFGQACRVGTVKQRVQGTPDFIAPEQAKCKPIGIFTDVYNFGATLYWALTDRRVPTLITVEKRSRSMLVDQDYPKPHEINPRVPQDLSEMVMSCVRVKTDSRPQSIAEVLQALEPYAK